jgi:hypothetical protein
LHPIRYNNTSITNMTVTIHPPHHHNPPAAFPHPESHHPSTFPFVAHNQLQSLREVHGD